MQCSDRTRAGPQCRRSGTENFDGYDYCYFHVKRWRRRGLGARASQDAVDSILTSASKAYLKERNEWESGLADRVFPMVPFTKGSRTTTYRVEPKEDD